MFTGWYFNREIYKCQKCQSVLPKDYFTGWQFNSDGIIAVVWRHNTPKRLLGLHGLCTETQHFVSGCGALAGRFLTKQSGLDKGKENSVYSAFIGFS